MAETEATGFSTMASSIEFADNYNTWILEKFSPYISRNVLEVGTGQGNFKRYLAKYPIDYYMSMDIDAEVIERAKARNPEGNYIVADASADHFAELFDRKYEAILMCNVLEHIEDHEKAVRNLLSILSSEGHLLLFVPALPMLYNDMDSMAGHWRRYYRSDLRKIIEKTGGKLIMNEYFNPIGGLGWWANKFMKHKDLDSPTINSQVRFFDKNIVPISKIINPITKSFFGQSLIVVIGKS